MNFFHKILPGYIPESAKGKGDLHILRERILQSMFLISILFGIPVVIMGAVQAAKSGAFFFTAGYIAMFLLFSAMIVFRDISYGIRSHILITSVYLLGITEIFESGELGAVRMFFLAFIALTAVLLNYKNVIATIFLSVVTIIAVYLYVQTTPNLPSVKLYRIIAGTDLPTMTSVFLLLSVALSSSIAIILSGLESNLKKQAELAQSLEYERDSLEDRIHERTRSMSRRMGQLRSASEIARIISELGDPDQLLARVVDLIKDRFGLYYVGIFLLDEAKTNAVLRAGTGEAGQHMLMDGHQLSVGGSSMIGWCISNRKARIALDVGAEAVRFNNPNLPLTRSELALPIMVRDEVLGALTIQSEKPNAFDENDLAVLQGIADSLAIALENAHLYNETRQSLEEIRMLNRAFLQRSWSETMEVHGELTYDYENALVAGSPDKPVYSVQVPLMLRNEVIGHIDLEMDQPVLSKDEASFIDNVTNQTAIALENARLLEETERRAIQEQKLNELASRFSRAMSIDEILRAATQEIGQLPAVAEVSIQLNPAGSANNITEHWNGGSNGKEHA